MKCYEVVFDKVSTSYAYNTFIYYKVTFTHNDKTIKVDTNPYFSSSIFSKFFLEEYNNKKVIGWYDDNIKKVLYYQKSKLIKSIFIHLTSGIITRGFYVPLTRDNVLVLIMQYILHNYSVKEFY